MKGMHQPIILQIFLPKTVKMKEFGPSLPLYPQLIVLLTSDEKLKKF